MFKSIEGEGNAAKTNYGTIVGSSSEEKAKSSTKNEKKEKAEKKK